MKIRNFIFIGIFGFSRSFAEECAKSIDPNKDLLVAMTKYHKNNSHGLKNQFYGHNGPEAQVTEARNCIKDAIIRNANVDLAGVDFIQRPLLLAVLGEDPEFAEWLLDHHAAVSKSPGDIASPIQEITDISDKGPKNNQVTSLLLRNGANPNEIIFKAVSDDFNLDFELVKLLIDSPSINPKLKNYKSQGIFDVLLETCDKIKTNASGVDSSSAFYERDRKNLEACRKCISYLDDRHLRPINRNAISNFFDQIRSYFVKSKTSQQTH